jgi:hypothetical protein
MSTFTEEYDLQGKTREEIEAGNTVPNGWYRTKITSVELEKDTGALLMQYTVTAGAHKGAKIGDRLMSPAQADSDNGRKVATNRRQLVASRLGLLPDDAFGKKATVNWLHAMNRECIIKVINRTFPKKDGTTGTACGPTFDGVYPVGDKRTPVEMGGEAREEDGKQGSAGAAAGNGVAAPPAPKRNFGNI